MTDLLTDLPKLGSEYVVVENNLTETTGLSHKTTRFALRVGACAVVGTLSAIVPAGVQAIENTRVVDSVVGFPTVLSYTHNDGSQVDFGVAGRAYLPRKGPSALAYQQK